MADSFKPSLNVQLAPQFDDAGTATSLSVELTFKNLDGGLHGGLQGGSPFQKGEVIWAFLNNANSKNPIPWDSQLKILGIRDERGPLTWNVQSLADQVVCKIDRQVQGPFTIQIDAQPVPDSVQSNDINALRKDQSGLVGVGQAFVPLPMSDVQLEVAINWDLSRAPSGTRAVTSFGEGDFLKTCRVQDLCSCVFMVGQINSFPPGPETRYPSSFCGTYWLGTLPDNLDALKDFSSNMFPHLSKFFRDEDGGYRAFIRNVGRGLKGTSLVASGLIDYGDDTADEHDWELVRLLNKTMISTWLRLDPEDDGTDNDWFTRGLSHLYSIYLPYRFKQRTPDYFRATMNGFLTAYFTNPSVSLPLQAATSAPAWGAESVSAMRGCIYMIRMDAFTRRASVNRNAGVERPIDEIVADISLRRRRGEKVQTKDWLAHLALWIGQEAATESFRNMQAGVVMDLEDMKTAYGGSLNLEEQLVLDLGFDKASLETGIVGAVKESSAAFVAGLRNGDSIKWHSRLELCETDYERKFTMRVERHGEEISLGYCPRGEREIRVWQSRKKA